MRAKQFDKSNKLNEVGGILLTARIDFRLAFGWGEDASYKQPVYRRLAKIYRQTSILSQKCRPK